MIYASVSQSAVVLPENKHAGLSFDEMVSQNYTFESVAGFSMIHKGGMHSKFILGQLKNAWAGNKQVDTLKREILLSERAQPVDYSITPHLSSILLKLNAKNRKVLAAGSGNRRMYGRIIKYLGRNVMEGRETFFSGQRYVLVFMPKPFILLQALEIMKAYGFMYHCFQRADAEFQRYGLRVSTSNEWNSTEPALQRHGDHGPAGF